MGFNIINRVFDFVTGNIQNPFLWIGVVDDKLCSNECVVPWFRGRRGLIIQGEILD